jgi:hypothetical protein
MPRHHCFSPLITPFFCRSFARFHAAGYYFRRLPDIFFGYAYAMPPLLSPLLLLIRQRQRDFPPMMLPISAIAAASFRRVLPPAPCRCCQLPPPYFHYYARRRLFADAAADAAMIFAGQRLFS